MPNRPFSKNNHNHHNNETFSMAQACKLKATGLLRLFVQMGSTAANSHAACLGRSAKIQ